ncbi:MAG: bacteriocin immunity protein [Lachnospiraceae bacterium]|nr:bacteriocin immunity protein [Lachnospiraceae bacterium]
MKNHLAPHRNLESEKQLKAIIQQIEELMYDPGSKEQVEDLLKEAAGLIKAPDMVLDLDLIKQYDGFTNLDTLVTELTMELPAAGLSREDLIDIVEMLLTMRDQETGESLSEAEYDALVTMFQKNINHPAGSDLIFYPQLAGLPSNPTSDEIVDFALKGTL